MNSPTILLIEDNHCDATFVKRALDESGIEMELIVTSDGGAALDYIFGTGQYAGRNTLALPHLIVTDLIMSRVNGFEVLRQVRAHNLTRRIPVVVLTSSVEQRDLVSAYDFGVNSYIQKPVGYRKLAPLIKLLASYWLLLNEVAPVRAEAAK